MGPNDDLSIPRTLLITLSGKDRPGVTSSVFATLARFITENMPHIHHQRSCVRRALTIRINVSESPRDAAKRANRATTNFQIAANVCREKYRHRIAVILAQAIF